MKTFILAAATLLLAAPVSAEMLYSDPFNYNPLGGTNTYNNGNYTQLDQNDIKSSPLYESTIQDRNGNLYDCNNIGSCHSRY